MAKRDQVKGTVADGRSDEERSADADKPAAEPKPKRKYFCEGTGVEIGHKARFAGMGYDAQLKSRLINAALEGKNGERFDNATGESITGPAEQLLKDLGWYGHFEKSRDSRDVKAKAKADRLAAASAAAAEKAGASKA